MKVIHNYVLVDRKQINEYWVYCEVRFLIITNDTSY